MSYNYHFRKKLIGVEVEAEVVVRAEVGVLAGVEAEVEVKVIAGVGAVAVAIAVVEAEVQVAQKPKKITG